MSVALVPVVPASLWAAQFARRTACFVFPLFCVPVRASSFFDLTPCVATDSEQAELASFLYELHNLTDRQGQGQHGAFSSREQVSRRMSISNTVSSPPHLGIAGYTRRASVVAEMLPLPDSADHTRVDASLPVPSVAPRGTDGMNLNYESKTAPNMKEGPPNGGRADVFADVDIVIASS